MKRIIFGLLIAGCSLSVAAQKNHNFEVSKYLDIFNTLYKEVDLNYVDSVDAEKSIGDAINYMLLRLDPYNSFYAEDNTNELKEMTLGKYAGIGSTIYYYKPEDRCIIDAPMKEQPADLAGLKRGDVIISIDGKDTGKKGNIKMEDFVSSVSEMLRGEPGTTFELKVVRNGKPMTFNITRANITRPSIPLAKMIDNTGYICFTQFTLGSAFDFLQAANKLKEEGATSLIIDLRDNGGGLLSEAVDIINLFVKKGKQVLYTKGKISEANSSYTTDKEPKFLDMPVAVIVNGYSASASEITAGALQDFDRAVIIGSRTYGKGLVQQTRQLPFNSTLKLTTAKYYIPSGRCIQKIDYTNRNSDGSLKYTPDSLTKVFYTEAGREVRDGGGITPDIIIKEDTLPNIMFSLDRSTELFDYISKYVATHPSIGPVNEFCISDTDYEDFKKFMKEKNFSYDRESLEELKLLKMAAKFEGYDKGAEAEFKALEAKLKHDIDYDFDFWKENIKNYLNENIASCYYYEHGKLENGLNYDKALKKAIEIVNNKEEYKNILKGKK